MKRIVILIVFSAIIMAGCFNLKDEDAYNIITIEEKIKEIYDTGERHDTIFMNLTFGMTEKEVNKVLKENLKKGKLEKSSSGEYQYTFYFKDSHYKKCKGVLKQEYHNNKLYKLKIDLIIMTLFDNDKRDAILDEMFKLYQEKYDFSYKVQWLSKYNYYDIKGNRVIHFNFDYAEITYTDMGPEYELRETERKILEEKRKKEKDEQKKEHEESINNL